MLWWTVFFVSLNVFYVLTMLVLVVIWLKIPTYKNPDNAKALTQVSVIVCVRNEARYIENLLESLANQSYPKDCYEVIVVDDNSEDGTLQLCEHFKKKSLLNLQVISLAKHEITFSPKKAAITQAITQHAQGELIMTTDGDCVVPKSWILTTASFYKENNAKLISGGVSFFGKRSPLFYFQIVEFASLIGTGATAMHLGQGNMCNGANLAYPKSVFQDVNGYENTPQVASGDDVFLLQKIKHKYPKQVFFLKSKTNIVHTAAQTNLSLFLQQRKRWASKWSSHGNIQTMLLPLAVFTFHIIWVLSLFFMSASWLFFFIFVLKNIFEFIFLGLILCYKHKKRYIVLVPFVQLIYSFYVVFFGLVSFSKNYRWKGRRFSSTQ